MSDYNIGKYRRMPRIKILVSIFVSSSFCPPKSCSIAWYRYVLCHYSICVVTNITFAILPNQELSEAKSALHGETVGVCSSYKRSGQPPYNLPAAHLRFAGIFSPSHYKEQYHLRPTIGLQGNFPHPNYKHTHELRPTCRKKFL